LNLMKWFEEPPPSIFDFMNRWWIGVAVFFFLGTCTTEKRPTNKFADPVLLRIAEFQDHRQSDSLLSFLSSPIGLYRAEAALAFASVQDSSVSSALGGILLEDTVAQVRVCAAYSLGQTGGTAAVNALIPSIQDRQALVARMALEALGKCIKKRDIGVLLDFKPSDSLREQGLSWAFYRMGLRGIVDSAIVMRQLEFLSSTHAMGVRIAAAQFFDRTTVRGSSYAEKIIKVARSDASANVRMAAAGALRKLSVDMTVSVVETILKNESDLRVRVNAIRALRSYPINTIKDLIRLGLKDSSDQVKVAASEVVKATGANEEFLPAAREAKDARVQANLYEALLVTVRDTAAVIHEIKKLYSDAIDPYHKSFLLGALSKDKFSYPFLMKALLSDSTYVIKTAAAQALSDINYSKTFPANWKDRFARLYQLAIEDGDPGVVGIISGTLADSTLGYKTVYKNIAFLAAAKSKLHLPRDIEFLQPLEEALAYFEGRPAPKPMKIPFTHPLDWTLIKSISANQQVEVITSRGTFIMRLLVNEAPGSVANFVDLVQRKYYDGKFVHRVVPNFVLQTGCFRGDGFGSEDYSIRSEFSMRAYVRGSVGYASAGKDTEGTQWFVTYSPTPHLNGRYSIFAHVDKGMDVADRIMVGDRIHSVKLISEP
jgi:cyclophilin family peptidyl-prolyl cis-trans isomerase/HEAT repeat protein